MRLTSAIIPIALLPAFLLAACGGTPQSAGSSPPPKEEAAGSYVWIGRDKVGKAITLLQNGDAAAARTILMDVLERQPSDAVAQSLVKQIDQDPKTLLGTESFAYTTREGDSFSSLAQAYLGNPTLFYALARYNGVTTPASLTKGTALRIPGHPKHEAKAEPRAESAAHAAAAPKAAPHPKATVPAVDPRRAALLRAHGLEELNRGAIASAVALLSQASRLDPSNPVIKRDLDRAIRIKHTVQGQ